MPTKTKAKNVTPAGKALWPRLNSPSTKFDDDGVYETQLILSPEDAAELIERCDTEAEEAWQKAIENESKPAKKNALKKYNYNPPYKDDVDSEGAETGDIVFKFKTKAINKDGSAKKLPLVDARKNPVSDIVGGGSTLKVAFASRGYQMPSSKTYGLTLYLNAVQVLDLVGPGGGGVGAFDEEDGYEAPEDAGSSDFADESDNESGSKSGDF